MRSFPTGNVSCAWWQVYEYKHNIATITARPQSAFRARRLFVKDPASWFIHNVRIGTRRQFGGEGPISANVFASLDTHLSMDAASAEMDIVIEVSYVGDNPDGEPFYGSMIGITAIGTPGSLGTSVLPLSSGRAIEPGGSSGVGHIRIDLDGHLCVLTRGPNGREWQVHRADQPETVAAAIPKPYEVSFALRDDAKFEVARAITFHLVEDGSPGRYPGSPMTPRWIGVDDRSGMVVIDVSAGVAMFDPNGLRDGADLTIEKRNFCHVCRDAGVADPWHVGDWVQVAIVHLATTEYDDAYGDEDEGEHPVIEIPERTELVWKFMCDEHRAGHAPSQE